MALIPPQVAETGLSRLLQQHLTLAHRGKVRDTYELPNDPDQLLVVATDRISIFDFVLGITIPRKGEVLTALTVFWLSEDTPIPVGLNHLNPIGFGENLDSHLPEALHGNKHLQRRALVVKRQKILPVECIVRGYLTGSGWKAYQKDGTVCGIKLPAGLHDGSRLDDPLFTPTTKAEQGHDEHLNAQAVIDQYGKGLAERSIAIYESARQYAEERGIILADTKFEMSKTMLCDEVLTPDSSRYWDVDEYQAAQQQKKSPPGFDKENVRQAGKKAVINGQSVDISKLDPVSESDVSLVASWHIPDEVQALTVNRYLDIVYRLSDLHLNNFQEQVMGIR